MPRYQIYRMKDSPRQTYRWAPQTAGRAAVRPRDYERSGSVEAPTPYSAWTRLRASGEALDVGDVLEAEDGSLRIFKYVGFEEAEWVTPELKSGTDTGAAAASPEPAPR